MVFTALQIGQASSLAGDVSRAKLSAARIIALLRHEPPIDTESPDGLKPVGNLNTYINVDFLLLCMGFISGGLLRVLECREERFLLRKSFLAAGVIFTHP